MNVLELEGAVVLAGLDAKRVAGRNAVLLTTGLDDCVHNFNLFWSQSAEGNACFSTS